MASEESDFDLVADLPARDAYVPTPGEAAFEDLVMKEETQFSLTFAEITELLQGLRLLPPFLVSRFREVAEDATFSEEEKIAAAAFTKHALELAVGLERKLRDATVTMAARAKQMIESTGELSDTKAATTQVMAKFMPPS